MQFKLFLSFLVLALLSFGPLMLHEGIFWDDYTFFGIESRLFMENWLHCGRPQLGWLHYGIQSINKSVYFYKILIFFFHLATSLLFFKTLRFLRSIPISFCIAATILFLILPINQTRDSIVLVQYQITLFLLFCGIYYFFKWKESPPFGNYKGRYLSLLFFIPSFTIEASITLLLVFIFIFCVVNTWHKQDFTFKNILNSLREELIFIIVPIVYIVAQLLFLKPYAGCANNNSIDLFNVAKIPTGLLKTIYSGFISSPLWPIYQIDKWSSWLLLAGFFAVLAVSLLKIDYQKLINFLKNRETRYVLILSSLLFLIGGVVPYVMVGKPPAFHDWAGRYQSHSGLGLVALALLLLSYFPNAKSLKYFSLAMIFIYVNSNFLMRIIYYRDHLKNEEITRQLKELDSFGSDISYYWESSLHHLRANKRELRFYELTALSAKARKKQDIFIYEGREDFDVLSLSLGFGYDEIYHVKDLNLDKIYPPKKKIVAKAIGDISLGETFLILLGINEELFNYKIENKWISLEIKDLTEEQKEVFE